MKIFIKTILILLALSTLPLHAAVVVTTGGYGYHNCYYRNGYYHGYCHRAGYYPYGYGYHRTGYYHRAGYYGGYRGGHYNRTVVRHGAHRTVYRSRVR